MVVPQCQLCCGDAMLPLASKVCNGQMFFFPIVADFHRLLKGGMQYGRLRRQRRMCLCVSGACVSSHNAMLSSCDLARADDGAHCDVLVGVACKDSSGLSIVAAVQDFAPGTASLTQDCF